MTEFAIESWCWGLLMAWLGADAVGLFGGAVPTPSDHSETRRRSSLRNSRWYDWSEAWTAPLAQVLRDRWSTFVDRMNQESAILLDIDWTFADRLALWITKGLAAAVFVLWLTMAAGIPLSVFSLFLASMAGAGAIFLQFSRFLVRVNDTRRKIRARMPMALELMALIMESGGGDIMSSWTTVTAENRGHPLGQHLQLVLDSMQRGMSFGEALQLWSDRSQEDDVAEVVLLLRTAKQRGTPIQENLRILSDQARLRRIQRLERAAEAARIHVTWPGFVMMMACLLIACAPLLLTVWRIFYPDTNFAEF